MTKRTTSPTQIQLTSAKEWIELTDAVYQSGFGPVICSWDEEQFLYLQDDPDDDDSFFAIDKDGNRVN